MNKIVNHVRKFGHSFKPSPTLLLFSRQHKWRGFFSNGVKSIFLLILITLFIASFSKNANSDVPKRILLIIMDGARYDYCTPETMPNLFSFMKEAMIFQKAYSPSSWTLPSHASLFTGLYPQQHGAFKLPYSVNTDVTTDTKRRFKEEINIDNVSISQEAITLADILRAAGYQTLGVFGNPCYGYPIFNLGKGFDTWVNVVENKLKKTSAKYRGFYSFDYEVGGKFYTVIPNASEVAAEVAAVLQAADQEKPIFLFINFEDPIATPFYFPPHERQAVIDDYKSHLRESMKRIDDLLPLILFFFRDGLIIVTSDHGQGDGTKFKATAHGTSLHHFQTKIPLFIHNFNPKNLAVDKAIDLTNVMDIILEATGLEYPSKNILFRPDVPIAFSHDDPRPASPIGKVASFSICANQCQLILERTSDGFIKQLYRDQGSEAGIFDDLLQIEKTLSEMILPFRKLERVFTKTERYRKLDEKNTEMLKSLGYIE